MLETLINFIQAQTVESLLNTFWFVLFIEIPRFTIGGICFLITLWWYRHRDPANPPPTPYAVTVIVPAHNSAASMVKTILSLQALTHVTLQVIVVNDGSNDDTHVRALALKARGLIDEYLPLSERGGKSAAVNLGLRFAKHPFFMVTDADTTFNQDSLWRACRYFRQPKVAAVSGNLEVRNWETNCVTRIQQVNYAFSITLGRLVRDSLQFYFVASGAFSVFRTSVVKSLGQWEFGPGEDGDISTRLRMAGYLVRFAHNATASTDVPDTWPSLANQRLRWDRSMIRLRYRKYRRVLNPFYANFKPLLAVSFFDIYWFQAIVPFLFYGYAIQLGLQYGWFALVIMLTVQICYILVDGFKYILLQLVLPSQARKWRLLAYIPLYSAANVYFLRLIKLLATANELTRRGSYQDAYVPLKVRRKAIRY